MDQVLPESIETELLGLAWMRLNPENIPLSNCVCGFIISHLKQLALDHQFVFQFLQQFNENPTHETSERIRREICRKKALPFVQKQLDDDVLGHEIGPWIPKTGDTGVYMKQNNSDAVEFASLEGMLDFFSTRTFSNEQERKAKLTAFITGYTTYYTRDDFFACLRYKIDNSKDEKAKQRLTDIVRLWYRVFPEDFDSSHICKEAHRLCETDFKVHDRKAKRYVDAAATELSKIACYQLLMIHKFGNVSVFSSIPKDIITMISRHILDNGRCYMNSPIYLELKFGGGVKQLEFSWNYLLSYSPRETATALFELDVQRFMNIRGSELVNQRWTDERREKIAPGIVEYQMHFLDITNGLATLIILQKTRKDRAAIMTFLIEVMHILMFDLRDFSGGINVLSVFEHVAVVRLEDHFKMVFANKSIHDKYKQSRNVLLRGMRDLRELEIALPNCIPFVGMHLSDLSLICSSDAGTKDGLPGYALWEMQGTSKACCFFPSYFSHAITSGRLIYDRILKVQTVLGKQKLPFYKNIGLIQSYIFSILKISEEILYNESLSIEPKRAKKRD